MDDVTIIENLFVPEVVAGEIKTKLTDNIQFINFAKFRDTLKNRAGDTVTRYKYSYIGDAEEFTEGNDISYGTLSQTPTTVTIKKAGRGVQLTDESVLNGIGDVEGEAVKQIRVAIANKVDNDCVGSLNSIVAQMTVGDGTAKIGANLVELALEKFGEEDGDEESTKVLFIARNQVKDIRNDENFIPASELKAEMMVSGSLGEILGCQIKVSNKIKDVNTKINNFILKGQPLAIEIKRDIMPERDRDIDKKITKCNADIHYGVYLEEDQNAVKIVSKGESTLEEEESTLEERIITFSVTDGEDAIENVTIVVKDSDDKVKLAETDDTYKLADGNYTYSVSATGYTSIEDVAFVVSKNATITVEMDLAESL